MTGTLKDLKIVVAQKQELGVEKGEEASCWTLDTNGGRNKKKHLEREKRNMGSYSPGIVSGSRHWAQTHPTLEAVAV